MAEPRYLTENFNEQQLMMIRLLKKPLPEEDFVQLRRLATKLSGERLDEALRQWELKNPVDPQA
jgi:hypothetical protein